ncbi:MAG: chorismate synthase [Deltaproteobacteria bacterium]|nr:chorismate synthase [Deltaproteobacteria bacterium]
MRYLTAGESHGKALVGILEGIPAGLRLTAEDIDAQLQRRKLGLGRGERQKIEADAVELLSGVRHGSTLGSPIALLIRNLDANDWDHVMQAEPWTGDVERQVTAPRPGHADLAGGLKYGHRDMRNVLERSSARETAMRVALGTVARRMLDACGVSIASRVTAVGGIQDPTPVDVAVEELNARVDASPLRCLGADAEAQMVAEVGRCKEEGDSLGGEFEVLASGVPLGLGSHVHWDRRLDGEIGRHFLSLNGVKGVEIGLGFRLAHVRGSAAHDELLPGSKPGKVRFCSNRSGGVAGGITTGQTLIVRAAMKPISTLMTPLRSVRLSSNEPASAHVERADVCAVPAAAVIGESLLALVLAEAMLVKFGGDSMDELLPRVKAWNEEESPE